MKTHALRHAILSSVLALVAGTSAASAQSAIVVRVSGAQGSLFGVTVEVSAPDVATRATTTDSAGIARLVGLPPATYRVRVEGGLGYRVGIVEGVRVDAGETRVVDVALELAPVELDELRVATDRIQIQRDNTDFATTVDEAAIELLPVAYDLAQLVALTPGARAEHVWGGANFQANSYQIDGLSANHPGLGGSMIEPSMSWIRRVEVRGLGAGAEHGGFQGGQVNVVTKSGTNDFAALLRSTLSNDIFSSSNLVRTETGSEVTDRYDVEGEVRGALVRDRLFYYMGGTYARRDARFLNHVDFEERYAPVLEERAVTKLFGKLTWTPRAYDELDLSGGYLGTEADNYGMTGFESPGAAARYTAPTWFANAAWRRSFGDRATLEASMNHFDRDERSDPYGGGARPGVRLFSLTPPYTSFGNAPFTLRSAPASTSAAVTTTLRVPTGAQEHSLKVGAEYTRGRFRDQRVRNGGMTWMPVLSDSFDPARPDSWSHPDEGFTPTEWGGEVDLSADVVNAAAFAQASISLGRLVLTPGLRLGLWEGWLDPVEGARFRAARDHGVDPRLGSTLELMADGSFVLKGHWGRYHQDMIAQMFDRAAGAEVFTNQEIWYYHGQPVADPTRPFTRAERDALAERGLFTRESVVTLNETGPVVDYKQPYIDQWLVGIEKQFGGSVKVEALYTRRDNRDMIALVDRNRETNYTRYDRVRVHMAGRGQALPFGGGSVYMDELYIPNSVVLEELRYCAAHPEICGPPPGLSFADTASLSWNPDYVLTNAPDARREFRQLQLTVKVARPGWGGSFSVAATGLRGNLDNVSGYTDPMEYSPGPYVRVNEGVNAYGFLPNFSEREAKVSLWGTLPGELRGGVFWTHQSGDHYAPRFRISSDPGFYGYLANAAPNVGPCNPRAGECPEPSGDWLPTRFLEPLDGHHVFIGPRGAPQMQRRANIDVRLERMFELDRFDLGVALDLFNALGAQHVIQVQSMVNHGPSFRYFIDDLSTPFNREWAGKKYRDPLERVPPRTLRLGLALYF